MKTKPDIIDAELVPSEGGAGKMESLAIWKGTCHFGTPAQLATQIQGDLDACERYTKASAFFAIRIGLRLVWVRDNGAHGSLIKFIEENFSTVSRRTLTNYVRVTDRFLIDAGLKDKKTFRLTNGEAIAPILEQQLDLFVNPEALKLEGALKKVVKWVGDRGLYQIYKDLSAGGKSLPPVNHGNDGNHSKRKPKPEQRRQDALSCVKALAAFSGSQNWKFLHDHELANLDVVLSDLLTAVGGLITERKRHQHQIDHKHGKPKGLKA